MHYTEDEIYELSLAREPRNSLSSVSFKHCTLLLQCYRSGYPLFLTSNAKLELERV